MCIRDSPYLLSFATIIRLHTDVNIDGKIVWLVAHTFSCIVWLIGILINKMLYQGSFELLFYSTVLLVSICQRSFALEFIIHNFSLLAWLRWVVSLNFIPFALKSCLSHWNHACRIAILPHSCLGVQRYKLLLINQ